MEVINNVTMLTIILVGAAFIREREHGTIEHLLVMPLTPFEIMMAKIWANGLAVLIGVTFALMVMVRQVLQVPIAGSVPLFLAGRLLPVFCGVDRHFLGTLARSMPQLGLLIIITIAADAFGGVTPRGACRPSSRTSGGAGDVFCPSCAGHPVSRCRLRCHLARPAGDDRRWRSLLWRGAGALPQGRDADPSLSSISIC
jgi:hypothetical protein